MVKSPALHIRIENKTRRSLEQIAKQRDITLTELIRQFVTEGVESLSKSLANIQIEGLRDDRKRYIASLRLMGLRVIPITKQILQGFGFDMPSSLAETDYILIMDSNSKQIWIEALPLPLIGRFYEDVEPKPYNLNGYVFDDYDLEEKNEEKIKQKLLNFIQKEKGNTFLDLAVEPNPEYLKCGEEFKSFFSTAQHSFRLYKAMEKIRGPSQYAFSALTQRIIEALYAEDKARDPYIPKMLPLESKSTLREKLLMIGPDRYSSDKIKQFSEAQYKDFLSYLTAAWTIYMKQQQGQRTLHNGIVIYKLYQHWLEAINEAKSKGEIQKPEEAFFVAMNAWCNRDKKDFSVKVTRDRPSLKRALEERKYSSQREIAVNALDQLERYWKKYFSLKES